MEKLKVIVNNHFDIVWRRCFERDIEFEGKNFVSYAKIEAYYIIDNIKLCEKYDFYKFQVESVIVLDTFLKNYPEYEEKVKELIQAGRLHIPFTGNNIVDSNLTAGEGIIRNFLHGYKYLQERYGLEPDGIDRWDAFGNSGQLPQIARMFGTKWMYNISYTECDRPYWRGIDGSTVFVHKPVCVGSTGGYYKYRPCLKCNGYGCEACGGRGIDEAYTEALRRKIILDEEKMDACEGVPYIAVGGEEILPSEYVAKWAEENKDKYDIEFSTMESYNKELQTEIENADNADEGMLHSMAEVNPNSTETFVTRIKSKQLLRENENRMTRAEALAAILLILKEKNLYPEIQEIWERFFYTMFHDSVTGTMVDDGYKELIDIHNEVENRLGGVTNEILSCLSEEKNGVITVYNPYGFKLTAEADIVINSKDSVTLIDECGNEACITDCIPVKDGIQISFMACDIDAFSKKEYKIERKENIKEVKYFDKKEEKTLSTVLQKSDDISNGQECTEIVVISNEKYEIIADEKGIKSIYDKSLGKMIAEENEYMVGEWILEHDEGSPWSTLSDDKKRYPLKDYTRLVRTEKTNGYEALVFEVIPWSLAGYGVSSVKIEYKVTLHRGIDKVMFSANVNWRTQNHRLRIAMPLTVTGRHFYDIPYGIIEREPYEGSCYTTAGTPDFNAATGDYPAINWAGVQTDEMSVAMFNKGTPSYRIERDDKATDTIFLSVLRSPTIAACLNEFEYQMDAYTRMDDRGEHSFEFALKSYDDAFDKNSAVTDGIAYNAKLAAVCGTLRIVDLPTVLDEGVYISSIKSAWNQKGIIIRIAECNGVSKRITVNIPEKFVCAYETDMKEDIICPLEINNGKIKLDIGKFEIKTLYLQTENGRNL